MGIIHLTANGMICLYIFASWFEPKILYPLAIGHEASGCPSD